MCHFEKIRHLKITLVRYSNLHRRREIVLLKVPITVGRPSLFFFLSENCPLVKNLNVKIVHYLDPNWINLTRYLKTPRCTTILIYNDAKE